MNLQGQDPHRPCRESVYQFQFRAKHSLRSGRRATTDCNRQLQDCRRLLLPPLPSTCRAAAMLFVPLLCKQAATSAQSPD
jgi:hypothetical protein